MVDKVEEAYREFDASVDEYVKASKTYDNAAEYRDKLVDVDGGKIAIQTANRKVSESLKHFLNTQENYENSMNRYLNALDDRFGKPVKEDFTPTL